MGKMRIYDDTELIGAPQFATWPFPGTKPEPEIEAPIVATENMWWRSGRRVGSLAYQAGKPYPAAEADQLEPASTFLAKKRR